MVNKVPCIKTNEDIHKSEVLRRRRGSEIYSGKTGEERHRDRKGGRDGRKKYKKKSEIENTQGWDRVKERNIH